jgi:hypothetical protein
MRRLVAGFSPLRLGFSPLIDNMGFMVDRVAVGQVSFLTHLFLLSINIS